MASSFGTYRAWEIIPIAVVCGIVFFVLLLVTAINVLRWLCKRFDGRKYKPFWPELVYGVPALLLKDTIKEIEDENKEKCEDESAHRVKYIVKNREVHLLAMLPFTWVAVLVVVCSFISFWGVFLIEELYTCDPGLDCFPINISDSHPLSRDPIANCSHYEDNDNVTILCYQFVYRYGEAAGTAGGILAFATIGVRVIVTTLFWIVDRKPRGFWRSLSHHIVSCLVIVGTLIIAGTLVLIMDRIAAVPFLKDIFLKSPKSDTEFFAYYATITCTTLLTAIAVLILWVRECKKKPSLLDLWRQKREKRSSNGSDYTPINTHPSSYGTINSGEQKDGEIEPFHVNS